jgi:hypothetical protein
MTPELSTALIDLVHAIEFFIGACTVFLGFIAAARFLK